jgi:FMN reductase [NAD(P)H]
MIDEIKVMETIGTDLLPSSILCIGYPKKVLQPKPKRALSELIHVIE